MNSSKESDDDGEKSPRKETISVATDQEFGSIDPLMVMFQRRRQHSVLLGAESGYSSRGSSSIRSSVTSKGENEEFISANPVAKKRCRVDSEDEAKSKHSNKTVNTASKRHRFLSSRYTGGAVKQPQKPVRKFKGFSLTSSKKKAIKAKKPPSNTQSSSSNVEAEREYYQIFQKPHQHSTSISQSVEDDKKQLIRITMPCLKSPPVPVSKKPQAPTKMATKPSEQEGIVDEVIEEIWHVSLKRENNDFVMSFHVKWEGYPPSDNTFEPYEHVSEVDALRDYVNRKFELHDDRIEAAMKEMLKQTKTLTAEFKKSKALVIKKLAKFDLLQFKCKLLALIYTREDPTTPIGQNYAFMNKLRIDNAVYPFYLKLEREKSENGHLIKEIKNTEKNSFNLTFENNIDFQSIPRFVYLAKMEYPVPNETQLGCDCKVVCSKLSGGCCPRKYSDVSKFVYDINGSLRADKHQMIVECNEFCSCKANCPNKHKKQKYSVRVFKTANRGWGLAAMQNISAGSFVIEYIGELITETEAKKRSAIYDKTGHSYLFDLDYNENEESHFSIDSTYKGNLSRFINHSCDGNLQTWPATSCNENSFMHRLYYFA